MKISVVGGFNLGFSTNPDRPGEMDITIEILGPRGSDVIEFKGEAALAFAQRFAAGLERFFEEEERRMAEKADAGGCGHA